MIDRYEVCLNGISIRDKDPRIIVTGIAESPPKEKTEAASLGYTHGTRLVKTVRQELSVAVTIVIKETDMRKRDAVYEVIRKWGRASGYLTISAREGQRLYIEEMGIKASGKKWTETITLVFTAYARPFWENVAAYGASIGTAALNGTAKLFAPGNADECTVDAEITAVGGTLTTLTVTVGGSSMSFAGLGIAAGGKLTISHTATGILTIKSGETSLLAKRTAASDDDLIAAPGASNDVGFDGNATCTATFRTRGRWL